MGPDTRLITSDRSDRKQTGQLPGSPDGSDSAMGAGKTVLFITRAGAFGFGGTEKHVLELIHTLCRRGSRPAIVCLQDDFYSARLRERMSVRCEPGLKSFWDWFRLCRELRPDVIVFVQGWLWSLPWSAYLAAKLAGIERRIAIDHIIPPAVPPQVPGRSLRSVLRRLIGWRRRYLLKIKATGYLCNRTICVSDAVRNALVRDYGFPAYKTVTIHNGVALSEFAPVDGVGGALRARLGFRSDDFVLLCAVRLTEVKGVDILLRAIARLGQDGANCKCVVVGDGPLKGSLSEQSLALGLADSVRFEDCRMMCGHTFVRAMPSC